MVVRAGGVSGAPNVDWTLVGVGASTSGVSPPRRGRPSATAGSGGPPIGSNRRGVTAEALPTSVSSARYVGADRGVYPGRSRAGVTRSAWPNGVLTKPVGSGRDASVVTACAGAVGEPDGGGTGAGGCAVACGAGTNAAGGFHGVGLTRDSAGRGAVATATAGDASCPDAGVLARTGLTPAGVEPWAAAAATLLTGPGGRSSVHCTAAPTAIRPPHTEHRARIDTLVILAGSTLYTDLHSGQETFIGCVAYWWTGRARRPARSACPDAGGRLRRRIQAAFWRIPSFPWQVRSRAMRL